MEAADQASRAFAYERTLELLNRLSALPRCPVESGEVEKRRAEALVGTGRSGEAFELLQELLEQERWPDLERAALWGRLGDCCQRLGDYRQAYRCLTQALQLRGVEPGGQLLDSLGFFPHWLWPRFVQSSTQSSEAVCRQLHRTLDRQLSVLFMLRPRGWIPESYHLARLQRQVVAKIATPESEAQSEFFLAFVTLQAG